jgi:hypothetical protein
VFVKQRQYQVRQLPPIDPNPKIAASLGQTG